MTESVEPIDQPVITMADREGKYLTFTLADEEFGIAVIDIIPMISLIFKIPMPYSSSARVKVKYLPSLSAMAITG